MTDKLYNAVSNFYTRKIAASGKDYSFPTSLFQKGYNCAEDRYVILRPNQRDPQNQGGDLKLCGDYIVRKLKELPSFGEIGTDILADTNGETKKRSGFYSRKQVKEYCNENQKRRFPIR